MSSAAFALAALLAVFSSHLVLAADDDFAFDLTDESELAIGKAPQKPIDIPFLERDVTVRVGRVFSYVVPKGVFGGNAVKGFEAKEGDKNHLPYWLLLDKTDLIFWGIPSSDDIGVHHISITPVDAPETAPYKFKVIVSEDDLPDTKCPNSEDSTILSFLIDRGSGEVKPLRKIVAINSIAKFFGLPYYVFKWSTQDEPDNINDSSVVLAGPGNLQKRVSKETALIQVTVGCEGRLSKEMKTVVHQLKRQARDGTISEVLQLPLVGWRVKTETTPALRAKRQAADNFGSGDYAYYDEYDYDDGESEDKDEDDVSKTEVPEVPIIISRNNTTTTSSSSKATTPATTTTTTSTTTSTTTTPLPTSETHPHRHHHGEAKPSEDFEVSSEVFREVVPPVFVETTTVSAEPTQIEQEIVPSSVRTIEVTPGVNSTVAPTTVKELVPDADLTDDYEDYGDEDDDDDIESETIVPDVPHQTTEKNIIVDFEPPIETTMIVFPSTSTTTTTSTMTTTTEPSTTTTSTTSTTEEPTTEVPTTQSVATTTTSTTTTSTTTTPATTTEVETTTMRQSTLRHLTKSTTTTTTETIEYEAKNFPPTIQNRLQRLAVTAGKVFVCRIPENTFVDMEDGNDLFLEFLDDKDMPVGNSSWCQFDALKNEVYGLPLDQDVSRWDFKIKATDKEGSSVTEKLEILVQQHKAKRVVNHEFSLNIHLQNKFPRYIDWCVKTLKELSRLYNSNISDFTVRRVEYTGDPVVLTWTNDSLPTNYCPDKDIKVLFEMLTANDRGEPSYQLSLALTPEIRVKKVTYQGLGVCDTQPKTPVTPPTNFSPFLRNAIDHINATVGELLIFKVPDDTFYDPEDQDSRMLTLTLLMGDRQPISPDHWLQFDSKNREFYGIPQKVGRSEYQLECRDSGGLPATDSLEIVVYQPPKLNYNVEFSMNIEITYSTFVKSANMQRKFVEKLQELFGDRNTSFIYLSNITEKRDGTVVTWYNKTLTSEKCPQDEISHLESILKHNDRTIASRVHHIMDPDFPVSTIKVMPINTCKVVKKIEENVPPPEVVPVNEETATHSKNDEYLVTFIVPAVIIAVMLLFAGIAALFLYRRRRTGKMNVEEDGRTNYGNKGIPVIFQEELDEKPESGTKTPVILKDEKPPLAPPEYSKSGSLKLHDDSEPYQPPPPFTRTQDNGRQARPKPTPTYRKPPPYVPP